jgi:outer membrane protein insertion porin family
MADPLSHTRARKAAFASTLALLLGGTALAAAPAAFAQAQQQSALISAIQVQGNERIDSETILSYLPLTVGQEVDPEKLDLALKALFKTDLFSDVKLDMDGSTLVVRVVENPVINQVLFEGNSNLKDDKLEDEIQIRPRGVFTRAKVEDDVGRIVELYRRSGRISATVTPKIVELPQRRVDLIFEIHEGPKSGILRVNFLGNKQFSGTDLRGVVVTKESAWYRFFSTNDNYDPDRIEYDREQLRKFYRNRGFYDFRVISSVAELAPDKNGFAVTYALDEGAKYRFGAVTVKTDLKKLNPDILRQILPIRAGQVYEDQKIEAATDDLTFAAGAAGFAFVDVHPTYKPDPVKHTVDVEFDVKEGPRVYIGRIDVVGNTATLDRVIRRRMLVSEGDAYNRALVDRSKQNVRALGFFKDVDVTNSPSSQPDRTDLQVKVTEQPTGQLSFSAGYSTVDKIVTDIAVTQSNFRGRGDNVGLRLDLGTLRQQIDLSYTEPHFLDRDLQAGWDLYAYKYNFYEYSDYNTTSAGAVFRLGFPITQRASLTTRYTIRTDDVIVQNDVCIPDEETVSPVLCEERGAYLTSSFGYTLAYDHRNDPNHPTRGFNVALAQDIAGAGGTVHYVKTVADAGWYHGFNKNFVLQITGTVGYIDGWNGDTIRIADRFYPGGDDFRGFEIAGIGPRDLKYGDALGAKFKAIGHIEESIPTFLPDQYGIKMSVFTDFGTAGLLDKRDLVNPDNPLQAESTVVDDLYFRATAGISIFWKSPMGPLRFDFSQIIRKDYYDRTELFRFSTATTF